MSAAMVGPIAASASVNALPIAVYSTDASGRITSYNDAAVEFWGRRPELGKEFWCGSWRLYWPDGNPMAHNECPMAMAIRENRPIRGAKAIVERPNGGRALFLPFPTPIYDDDGTLVAAVNVLVEIMGDGSTGGMPARANVDGEVRVGTDAGERVSIQTPEIARQDIRGLAHDLNNVLQGLQSCFSLLRAEIPGEQKQRIYTAIEQNIRHGRRLTQHLLTFGRHRTLSPEPTYLESLLAGMRPVLESLMRGSTVEVDVAEDTWPVLVDPSELELAILNLSMNARDAMLSGGTLSFSTANTSIATDDIRGHPADLAAGDYVTTIVADSGTGMDEATLSRACEPFFTTKAAGKGSGLGLSMVQAIAEHSGGCMKIDSQFGRGTTVTIYLPRTSASPEQAPSQPKRGAVPR